MATLGITAATDLAAQLLNFYVKKGPLFQNIQDKPLLRNLVAAGETFPGGKETVSIAVQGQFVDNYLGYTEDESLTFVNADGVKRVEYPWKELASNLWCTYTELKKDGVLIDENNKARNTTNADAVRITTSVLKNKLASFGEGLAQNRNKMLWRDGTQDAKAVPGITSILTDDPNNGTTGGLDRATYTWWRHRARVGALAVTANTGPAITPSVTDQTLTKTLRAEVRQLMRYGGKPNRIYAGSAFIEALEAEVFEKGIYTQEGFKNEGKTDIGMAKISMRGVGTIEYDPTLDESYMGRSKYAYFIDDRRIKLRPMEGGWNRIHNPTRPYNYMVFLQTVTDTAALVCDQLNCHGVYAIA